MSMDLVIVMKWVKSVIGCARSTNSISLILLQLIIFCFCFQHDEKFRLISVTNDLEGETMTIDEFQRLNGLQWPIL